MTTPSPRPANGRQALADLQAALGSVARPNPVVLAWRWRYELMLAAAITLGGIALARIPSAIWMLAGCAPLIAIVVLCPSARRLLAARAWCIVTQHRVRAGCAGAWIHSRRGKLPVVLFTRRQLFGERVYLWCPAGTSKQDFEAARKLLITACWARDMKVSCHPRYAQLVTLDVIRQTPKATGSHIASHCSGKAAVQPSASLAGIAPVILLGIVVLVVGAVMGGIVAGAALL